MRPRCCLCRSTRHDLETTDLPGSGHRCIDRERCRIRVANIVASHTGLAAILNDEG